jgi:hypothetical protein
MTSDADKGLDCPDLPRVERLERQSVSYKRVLKADWRNRDFMDFNGLGATFEDCDFRYSIFERAYFRDAKFINCRFDGSRFIDCNMRNARFMKCEFKFAGFSRCLLDVREIIAALPPQPNIRRETLRNLKANAIEVGDYESIKLIVLQELDANKLHYKHAALGFDAYYKQKYALFSQRFVAGAQFAFLKIDQWIWGHGERPWQLLVSAGLLLLVLTGLNFWAVVPKTGWAQTQSGGQIFIYSLRTFLDMAVDPRFQGFQLVDYALVIMRYVYIGLFVSVLYKVISHR